MNKERLSFWIMSLTLAFLIGSGMMRNNSTVSGQILQDSIASAFPDSLVDSSDVESIIEIVNAVNAGDMPQPSSEFRKGHVSPSSALTPVTLTDYGYSIKLPAGNGVPTPTWNNNRLYVSGGFGSKQYFCFNATDGDKIWGIDLDDDGPSSCVIRDSIAVFNTESCTIFACNELTGEHLWSYWLGDPLMTTPTIANNMVFTTYPAYGNFAQVPGFDSLVQGKFYPTHVLIAFDLHTGRILWQNWVDGDAITAPVAKGDELHVVSFTGTYYVLDQKSGEFKSADRIRGTTAPVFCESGTIVSKRSERAGEATASECVGYVGDGAFKANYKRQSATYIDHEVQNESKQKQLAMDDDAGNGFSGGAPASSGADKAMLNVGASNVSTLQAYVGSRTLNDGNMNYNTMGDTVICTDERTGQVKWKRGIAGDANQIGGFLGTPPIKVGDYILVATYDGDIILSDPATGEEKKRWKTGEPIRSQPIAENGWIFAATANGKVLAINTEDKSIAGWPMLGRNEAHTN